MLHGAVVMGLWVSLAVGDGFGGAPAPTPPATKKGATPAPSGDDSACMVQGDDGVWRTCAELLEMKAQERERQEAEREAARAEPDLPAPAPVAPPPPPEKPKSKLQQEIEKAGLDPKLPLTALRIRQAELAEELEVLDRGGYPESRKAPLIAELAETKRVLAEAELLALNRMMACAKKQGMPFEIKRVRMTPAGPILLSWQEMVAQLPPSDPFPCSRVYLLEQESIDRVRRSFEVFRTLRGNTLGYHQRAERDALEAEQKTLDAWRRKEGLEPLANKRRLEGE